MKSLRFLTALALLTALWAGVAENLLGDGQQGLRDAEQVYRSEGPEAALPLFEELAAGFEAAADRQSAGRAIGFVGEAHWRLGNYEQAAKFLDQALAIKRDTGDRLQEGKTLNVLGLLNWDLGEFARAKTYFAEGSAIAEELGDRRLAGAILNNLSLVHDELGDYYVSLDQYQRVLQLYETVDFPRGQGDTLGNIGGVYLLLGRYEEALPYYRQALAISEQLDSAISMSQDHGNIALCQLGLGRVDAALEHLQQAVELARAAGMQQDEAYWLGVRGDALLRKGEYGRALDSQRAALELYRQVGGRTEMVEALHHMGQLHLQLGDAASAERHFRDAMDLAWEIGLSRGVTINLFALGDLQARRGETGAAAALFTEGVERAREAGAMASWAEGLLGLAAVNRERGDFVQADIAATRALEIARETGAVGLEAWALFELAEIKRLSQENHGSPNAYDPVIAALARAPDTDLRWRAHYGQGLAFEQSGYTEQAIAALQAAVQVIESVRSRLQQERFRAGYIQDKYQVYVDLVRLQLQAGQEQEAFETAERLRSRSYLDLLENSRLAVRANDEEQREFALRERIRTLRETLSAEHARTRQEQRQLAINVYSAELLAAEQEYQALLDERRRPGRSEHTAAAPSYEQVRVHMGSQEALLEYVVGPDQLMLFILTRESLVAHTVPVRRTDLENKVELVRNLIGQRHGDRWHRPAASLHRYLLQPALSAGALDGIDHLYLVPHGALNYLPFAILAGDGERSRKVIDDFTLTYLPTAAALLEQNDRGSGSGTLLALAPARSRLQYAETEAQAVQALFAPHARALLGTSATEGAFKAEAANYRLLHLATHGYFNKLNPLLSGLQLESDPANDGLLELHEILGLRLSAELVTLSACQTGMGSGHFGEIPAGDDFIGLTRAFLFAGSTSVLATLWEVDDASTAGLMQQFYGVLKSAYPGADRARALAAAQRSMLASKQFQHPYFWAPFVLVGNTGGARVNSS
jgi:CHAT domain-containing protein